VPRLVHHNIHDLHPTACTTGAWNTGGLFQ
jgi:hypothetical protein